MSSDTLTPAMRNKIRRIRDGLDAFEKSPQSNYAAAIAKAARELESIMRAADGAAHNARVVK